MTSSWIGRAKGGWKRTERLRAGIRAGLRTGAIVAGSGRAIGSAPVPERPDVTRTEDPSISRRVEREGATRLRDYGTYEVNRLADQQRRLVEDLPRRAGADRTDRAVRSDRPRGTTRPSPGRGR